MTISIKSQSEIEKMRESCKRLAIVHYELSKIIKPGISTYYIDETGEKLIRELGGIPNFKNYNGYPASICVSVNDEVVHGIPNRNRILKDGDIVSLDAGMIVDGYHSDAARTYAVGEVSDSVRKLIEVTKKSFFAGIKKAKAGNYLNDISNAIDDYISPFSYGIVEELTGHGIGTSLHEDPPVYNFRQKNRGPLLKSGMTLAIEPMVTLGVAPVEMLDDDWTIVTADGSWAAHYENTVLVTENGPEILTLKEDDPDWDLFETI